MSLSGKRQTRSATRANTMKTATGSESGLQASSPPDLRSRMVQQPARSSVVGGLSDHGELPPSELTPASVRTVRAPCSVSRTSSRMSQARREANRMRAEYEAELKMAQIEQETTQKEKEREQKEKEREQKEKEREQKEKERAQDLVRKKLALDLAELAAQEDSVEQYESPRSVASGEISERVSRWLDDTPAVAHMEERSVLGNDDASMHVASAAAHATAASMHMASTAARVTDASMHVAFAATHAPNASMHVVPATATRAPKLLHPPPETLPMPPKSQALTDIDRLAEAISKLGQGRNVPRQVYEIPQFDGNAADWLSFQQAYRTSNEMHDFQPLENMARLRVALVGEAKTAVRDLLRTSSDPEEILKALEDEFGHPIRLLECAIKKVRDLPRVSENGLELRKFTSTVRNCVAVLKSIRADGYINNPQLVSELLNKLTPYQRSQYGQFAMRLDNSSGIDLRVSPNLNILVDFLSQLTRASSYHVPMSLNDASYADANRKFGARAGTERGSTAAARRDRDKAVASGGANHRVHTQVESISAVTRTETSAKKSCVKCKRDHNLSECRDFKNISVQERWDLVKQNRICFRCMVKTHSRKFCRAPRCSKCNLSHHDLLHLDRNEAPPVVESPSNVPPPPRATVALETSSPPPVRYETLTSVGENRARALLKVLPVTIVTSAGVEQSLYALLDDGASVSILDDKFASDVDGPIVPLKLMTARGHCVTDSKSRSVQIVVRGPNGVNHDITVRTLRNVNLPSQTLPARVIRDNGHLRGLDCSEMKDAKPMLLLGQDNWKLIVGEEIRQGKSGRPVASLTRLGWVVHGPLGGRVDGNEVDSANCISIPHDDLHALVQSQFELEAIGISHVLRKNCNSERALGILNKTCRRAPDDVPQWEVGLLWSRDNVEMPDNYDYARKRLAGIEKKMDRDPSFADAYTKQVARLLTSGYARKAEGVRASPVWYLPHFGVSNPNKPGKLRLVFDAAATYQGASLNDNLLSGPDLMNSLLGILIRFRTGRIAFTADIADMFLRVKIREADQGAQLFLWRGQDRIEEPSIYIMTSMIFGAASSPTSAIYVLNKNAEHFKDTHPAAVEAIRKRHYVDDYIDSVDSIDTAQQLIADVTHIHRAGGFDIRGWVTNSPELRERLPDVVPGRVKLDKSDSERTLGMIWCPSSDCMRFDLSFKRLSTKLVEGQIKPTKREFLKFIMSIFDPLGLVYPCIIQSRVLMQRVWQSGILWDECIKDAEATMWFQWLQKLKALSNVAVPRWYGLDGTAVDLHVFGDASEKAYAAVAFLVGTDVEGNRVCSMVAGKARVAPVKVVSIPRLELQAAVLACRLAVTVKAEINLVIENTYLWTDSKTVLMWINSDARDYQKYVSHRLAEIDSISKRSNWHWVPSESNPADEATRMDWPNNKGMWISGPPFLCDPQVPWPSYSGEQFPADDMERIEKVLAVGDYAQPLIDVKRYSTWTRALRVTARVFHFINACRYKQRTTGGALTISDLREAERILLKQSQVQSFSEELCALRAKRSIPNASRLLKLDPILYDDELLRVGGRLGAATELSFDEKHPVILDGSCYITRLLVQHYHARALHANHETVINNLRERFWVTASRPTVKAVVARCQHCRVLRARPKPPKMGDLPLVRLTTTRRAFVNCGIDYFGPMEITIGRRREKRWGVLFTCLATRAIHLELAASLSSDSAILALRRMIARRGQPSIILSDCGTNFIGANKELRAAIRGLNTEQLQGEALAKGIEWRFNAPAAPHMGGAWERLVRSVKNALHAILKERAPSEEVLHTVLLEAELIVNSRPISYVASDPDEPVVLTPNHLLLGTAAGDTRLTTYDPADVDARRLWKKANGLAEMFWRRWAKEYLPTLQRRSKWTTATNLVKVGDIVFIRDGKQPRNVWPRGVIDKVYPGSGGHVRVVDVRTPTGTLRRPVTRVAVLPTDGSVIG